MGTYTLKHTGPEVDRALDDVTVLSETVDELAETVSNLASQAPGSSSGSGAIDCEPGKIFAYAGSGTPQGALLCNGQEVSRTTYSELFDTIGIRYGDGDGSTTFNLPNISSRTIIGESGSYELGTVGGEESHKLTVAEMPSHLHSWKGVNTGSDTTSGSYNIALFGIDSADAYQAQGKGGQPAGGDQPHNNMQPYIVMRYFITTGKGNPVSGGTTTGHFEEVTITGQTVSTKPSNEAFLIQHGTESASAMYAAKRTDTDISIRFGVGSGGINHGVYSDSLSDWIIYNDGGAHSKTPKLHVTGTTDISGTADNDAPLIIGNRAGTHMAFDGNEIQVKSDGTTPATLNLMIDGGNLVFGKSGGTGTFKINNRAYGTNKVLWSGSHYMDETQTITLSEAISSQPNGIVLSWCWYQNGAAQDYDWVHNFIPKHHITSQSGDGVQCDGFGIDGHMAKYMYPTDTTLRGYSYNDATCEKDGVTFHNANYVLKYVIGV